LTAALPRDAAVNFTAVKLNHGKITALNIAFKYII